MKSHRVAAEGIRALGAHRLRTFLMMLGTIIGVASLTVIMAVGKGTEKKIRKRLDNFGANAIMILAGGGKAQGPDMTATTLTLADAEAVRQQIDGLELVSPMAWKLGMDLKRDANQHEATVWGVESNWHKSYEWYTSVGEGISDHDVVTQARVCVLGETVRRELFGDEDAIGQHIYVNKVRLTVKGVLERHGVSPGGGDFDNRVILPLRTAMRRVMNVEHLGAIRTISARPDAIADQADQIRQLLHERHRITAPREDDFRITTAEKIAKFVKGASATLSIMLTALAALSLVVGGVVLMNILLLSVKERTKEIGLRRALGATRRDIFVQFLTESVAVTLLGMILGVGAGWAIATILPRITPLPAVISWEPFALGVCAAVVVGTFFGIQPARKAASLHPVEALS